MGSGHLVIEPDDRDDPVDEIRCYGGDHKEKKRDRKIANAYELGVSHKRYGKPWQAPRKAYLKSAYQRGWDDMAEIIREETSGFLSAY